MFPYWHFVGLLLESMTKLLFQALVQACGQLHLLGGLLNNVFIYFQIIFIVEVSNIMQTPVKN